MVDALVEDEAGLGAGKRRRVLACELGGAAVVPEVGGLLVHLEEAVGAAAHDEHQARRLALDLRHGEPGAAEPGAARSRPEPLGGWEE